ncbi:MAG TPA: peptidylprolyl isomerase [Candidatus Anammoximicrobium sp.]|nr:peptidylprolyl isomerase [Candidatus Anammoximicrobium sp.]
MLRHWLRFVQPLGFVFSVCLAVAAAAAEQESPKPATAAEAAAPKADAPPPAAEAKPATAPGEGAAAEAKKPEEPAKTKAKEAPEPTKDAKEAPKPDAEPTAKPAEAREAKPEAGKDAAAPAEAFAAKLAEWKEVLKELRKLRADYRTATPDQIAEIQTKWTETLAKAEAMIDPLREAGKAAYLAAPNADNALTDFLVKVVADDVARDNYEPAAEVAKALSDNGCDKKELFDPAGVAAFATNDFESAEKQLKRAQSAGTLGENGRKFVDEIDNYKKYWQEEQEIRKKEAEANDLPRVRLRTTKGDIVIELFENEAPEAVGNFISLVEQKFYDGLTFHRVLAGFMAQGGCPRGDGTGDPGYKIYCECYKDNYRKHFRGTLSMAHAGKDTGGSQFFLTFLPTPHLNGKHTAFGRVIEGMDVLAKLQRINPEDQGSKPDPDKIITAEVIRKRDHKYEPHKVQ